ncbi:hypothetical protein [Hydrogenophaga electricum]|uniref:Lipoprotein n=1 Tax=Hydrogenophaga electricum TaxID=1230953 RepID=A0ABQ6C7P1_9BURK|nr:hypothetical protein GCM10007935_16630 [Hydrogenophaga electricum]
MTPMRPNTFGRLALATLLTTSVLAACSSSPPPPDWQMNAQSAVERAADAWLAGNDRVAQAEITRARSEVARTGQPALAARLELAHCATRVAALVFDACEAYAPLAIDAAAPEQAYARYLQGEAGSADAERLPSAQRPLAQASLAGAGTDLAPALARIDDPLSRLVAAGVLLLRGQASPAVVADAVATASAQGWRRPLMAWLRVQQERARSGGAEDDVQRLQRRIDLVGGPSPTK